MIERAVVCALVVNDAKRLLLIRNPAWGNLLAIPTKEIDPDSAAMGPAALAALRADTGLALPNARVLPLGYLATGGRSGRTGETTLYHYWAFHIEPGENFTLPADRAVLWTADEIAAAEDVTWTARDVVAALFQNQEAALAVITRPGRTETEYLVLWNANYEGFFFPAARVTAEFPPASVARSVIRAELGYTGPVEVTELGEVREFQFSPRWGRERAYRFHVVRVDFPPRDDEVMDLHRPFGPMDRLLGAAEVRRGYGNDDLPAGWSWRWLTGDELRRPPLGVQFTGTMDAVVPSVLAAVPPVVRDLRRSEGSVALVRGTTTSGGTGWLAQWNAGWGCYALIGGHRDGSESFRDCVAREVREELDIKPGEPDGFTVAAAPVPLRYVAWSRRAGEYTDYDIHAFTVTLDPARRDAVARAAAELDLRWLSASEVLARETVDGRRVSETAEVHLRLSGQL